jgi:23S rRNA (adenine2030-N6)-methyltransferase
MMLIDPSYEVKDDYLTIPRHMAKLNRAWNVGIIALWYPLLTNKAHIPMLSALSDTFPEALRHEVRFAPARPGHGMVGSGLFVINPPYGMSQEAASLSKKFNAL